MKIFNEYQKRELVSDFYTEHCSKGKAYTVKHFLLMGMKKSTVYNIISRVEKNIEMTRKQGSGRICKKDGFE